MMITEFLQILPGSYTITSTRSMPGQRLRDSTRMPVRPASDKWIRSGLHPFLERLLDDAAFWHELGRFGNALVVIVQNVTTEINSTPVALVISRDLVIHTAAALQHVCAPCLAKPDAKKKHKMTERSHWRRQPASNKNFEQTPNCHERNYLRRFCHVCVSPRA